MHTDKNKVFDSFEAEEVNLTNCDLEPIHIPESIQSHGMLIAAKITDFKIFRVSSNTYEFIKIHPEEILGQSLPELLGAEQLDSIKGCLAEDFEYVNPLKIYIDNADKRTVFDCIAYHINECLILELEPTNTKEYVNFLGFYNLVNKSTRKVINSSTLLGMCQNVVKEIRRVTGFERVMVYKFDDDETGSVIAEDKPEDIPPYLGLRYPRSDIPQQARKLYTVNWLRIIPDVNYQPVKILFSRDFIASYESLDLSLSTLRSVSPIHIEYLQNMGVTASMSISIMRNKKLWGLIACHDSQPRYLSYEVRTACEFLGKIFSSEIFDKEQNEDLDYKMRLKSIQTQLIESISGADNLLNGLTTVESNLLDIVSATGVAIYSSDELRLIGKTPPENDLNQLLNWVEKNTEDNLFYTHHLAQHYPSAVQFKDTASGLLVLAISRVHRTYILWFRPEVTKTVNWGGNPEKAVEKLENGELRIHPRKSFQSWQESVKNNSRKWKDCELEAIAQLRSAMVSIVLHKADELAKINIELERSNHELDAFAYIASHDLKEPLRGIHNYSNFLMEDYADLLDEDGVSKLKTLTHLTQRMEDLINSLLHFSRLGRVELSLQSTDLNELLDSVIDVINMVRGNTKVDIRIPKPLPMIMCDRVQINELLTNLISNAIKYNNKPQKWVEIGSHGTIQKESQLMEVFYVKDNGIGIAQKHYDNIFRIFKRLHGRTEYGGGTGAGLTISRKIVERHQGEIWLESETNRGTTFYFSLPAVQNNL